MSTAELIKEIEKLSRQDRIFVIERAIKLLGYEEDTHQMRRAANEMYEECKTNKELTVFTDIDMEDFYEPR